MKRFLAIALTAVASLGLLARPAAAANTPILTGGFLSDLVSGNANEQDINALFNAVGLTATSLSVTTGGFSFLDTSKPVVKQVEYSVLGGSYTLGLSFGSRNEILGINLNPIRPPSSRPIPEARTLLLYPLGLLAVGWMVLRSRRSSATHR